jgi:transposase
VLYSAAIFPDLNPIEFFPKLKTLLRKAAKRSTEELWEQIGQLRFTIPESECANDFASSAYVST